MSALKIAGIDLAKKIFISSLSMSMESSREGQAHAYPIT